jgi:hypothetical protein
MIRRPASEEMLRAKTLVLLGLFAIAAARAQVGVVLGTQNLLCTARAATVSNVGCIAESLIPDAGTYAVKFEDGAGGSKEADVCWKTCNLVYPNTTIALVRWKNTGEEGSGKLDCRCAEGDRIGADVVGPDIWCNSVCQQKEVCGGEHTFKEGTRFRYFSIYCLPGKGGGGGGGGTANATTVELRAVVMQPPPPGQQKDQERNLDIDTKKEIEATLNDIYVTMGKTNIVSIVAIGLMVLVIILVLILLVWTYLFIENFDPNVSTSLFYRKLSGPRRGHTIGHVIAVIMFQLFTPKSNSSHCNFAPVTVARKYLQKKVL